MKKFGMIIVIILSIILFFECMSYYIRGANNIGKAIKCPTLAVGYEYEGVIKAQYKTLLLIDGAYSYVDWDSVYDGCYYDDGLNENKLVCPEGYNTGAWVESKGEFVVDMEQDNCYYVDDDESMLKAIYKERHRK